MNELRAVAALALLFTAACDKPAEQEPPTGSSDDHQQARTHPEPSKAHASHGEGQAHHGEHATAERPANLNPVQHEMLLLTAALESAVRGIGTGDVRPVEHALHQVHGAKEATSEAIADGSYRPPKNPDDIERFRELDEAFHAKLGKLVAASRANDLNATADALGEVLDGCPGCHTEFRR